MIRIFKHYMPISMLMLGMVEAAIVFLSMYTGTAIRFFDNYPGFPDFGFVTYSLPQALLFMVIIVCSMIAVGLYQREHQPPAWHYARVGVGFAISLVIMTLIFYALPALSLERRIFAINFLTAVLGVLLARQVYFRLTHYNTAKRRVLVLGTGTRAAKVGTLEKSGGVAVGFQVVGYLPLKGEHHFVEKDKILSDTGPLCDIAKKYQAEEIVVGVRDRRGGGLPIDEVLTCKLNGVDVVELSSFFERETGCVQLQSLNPSWLIFSDGFDRGLLRDTSKRLFDVVVSGILLVVALPIMALTALLIKLDSRGPILYRQERIGQGGAAFDVLKFRSMRTDAEKDGKPQWAKQNDSRVTRVGRVIRLLRIDELPQIFNVLKGEMSFVGPRPERPFFVDQLSEMIPYFMYRHNVKPGITGWAQIRYSYGSSVEDAIEKLQYDLYYVKNHSFFLDLVVLFQTMQVILFHKGAR